jgi:sucrose phosphorylase
MLRGAEPARLHDLLARLYGPERAGAIAPRLLDRLETHRRRLSSPPPSAGPWTAADAFVITYPDQVRQPGSAPLASLLDFLRSRLEGVVSGVHLLPFYPSSSDDGFSVIDYSAVDPAFGSWTDVRAFAGRFRLMVDLVLNHASARSRWFQAFLRGESPYREYFLAPEPGSDWSMVVRPRTSPLFTGFPTASGDCLVWTTFSADQVDLDYRNPDLLLEMIDVLLTYVGHGAQLIRLDAIAYVWKAAATSCIHLPQVHTLVRLFRAALDAAAPWARLITETNVPHAENVAYFAGGDGADLVYQFALPPLVLHSLTSGSARALTEWAASLETPPGEATFFNFLASHDGIGVTPVDGILGPPDLERLLEIARDRGAVSYRSGPGGEPRPYELNVNLLDALSRPSSPQPDVSRMLAAHAIQLSMPGVPAIYIHSLFGSRGDREAAQASGQPRHINRRRFDRARLEAELDDPQTERARVLAGIRRLLRARSSSAAFHPRAGFLAHDLSPGVFSLERLPGGGPSPVLCLHEVSGRPARVPIPARFGGGRDLIAGSALAGEPEIGLNPYQSMWIEAR